MTAIALFVATVLIWGTTWIGIAAQLIDGEPLSATMHRFALAGVLMAPAMWAMGKLRRPRRWRFVLAQALCLFSCNFIGLYNATALIPSGMVAVVFSLASILNAVNARIWFADAVSPRTVLAGVLGAAGVTLLFLPDLTGAAGAETLQGLLWAAAGTLFFSLGNMASRRNVDEGVSPAQANAWGMPIGAAVLLALCIIQDARLLPPATPLYWGATAYLAVIGSIAGFTAYLALAQRIGSARAGYATVLFPVVAMGLSTLFEDYRWTWGALLGVALILIGNVVMFAPPRRSAARLN